MSSKGSKNGLCNSYDNKFLCIPILGGRVISGGCVYCFCQIFQGICLLKELRLFQTLEYLICVYSENNELSTHFKALFWHFSVNHKDFVYAFASKFHLHAFDIFETSLQVFDLPSCWSGKKNIRPLKSFHFKRNPKNLKSKTRHFFSVSVHIQGTFFFGKVNIRRNSQKW